MKTAPGTRSRATRLRIDCNYLSLCDNLLDPAHVTFVHATTLGTPAGATVPVNNEYRNNEICVWRWIRNGPPIPLFAKFGGLKRHGRSLALL